MRRGILIAFLVTILTCNAPTFAGETEKITIVTIACADLDTIEIVVNAKASNLYAAYFVEREAKKRMACWSTSVSVPSLTNIYFLPDYFTYYTFNKNWTKVYGAVQVTLYGHTFHALIAFDVTDILN